MGGLREDKAERRAVPYISPSTQHLILLILAPSYVDDRKRLNESSKIGVMNRVVKFYR